MKKNAFSKTILILGLIFLLCLNCGFKKKNKLKPYVLFGKDTISQSSLTNIEKFFSVGQKINFLVYNPDGFKSNLVRIQILKKDEKVEQWGISIVHARDIQIDTSKPYFTNTIVLWQEGYYIFRVFSHDNMKKPFVETDFWIKE